MFQRPHFRPEGSMAGPIPQPPITRPYGNDALVPPMGPANAGSIPQMPRPNIPMPMAGPMTTPLPQRQAPPHMLGTPPTAPPGFGFQQQVNQILDPAPYHQAVDRGNQFLQNIPKTANPLLSASPAFRTMNPAMRSGLNQQAQARGRDLENQGRLEFARKAGTEVPQLLLSKALGLRGLENDLSELQNDFYKNDILRTTGGIDIYTRLLAALGGFF